MSFDGFSTSALTFLKRLPDRSPDWFRAQASEYRSLLADPAKALVRDLGGRMRTLRPELTAEPKTNGSIAPIHNDRRFAPDKAPYKDHLLLRFWEGGAKKTAPTLYVRIAPESVGFATGVVPADLDTWRSLVDGAAGSRLAAGLRALQDEHGAEVVGRSLKRVPAPHASDHPRADLLRHKFLQVRWPEPIPEAIHSSAFVEWCAQRLESCLPVHAILVESLS